jgi:hypothetical protein
MSSTGVNQPQHKVGDIVNGHILTAQNEWMPVAPAPSTPAATPPEKPKRKWFLRKRVLIPVGLLALIIIISNLNGPPKTDDAASVEAAAVAAKEPVAAEEEPASAEEEPAAEPVAEAATAPEAGTATNPLPQPYVAQGLFGGDKYTLAGRVSADGPDVTQWNMFNDPAPAGFKWVVVELTMTGIDKDGVEPSLASFDLSLSTPEGNQYNEDSGLVLGDGMSKMYEGPTLYPGSAFTGHMTFLVPEASAGFMLYDNGNYIAL